MKLKEYLIDYFCKKNKPSVKKGEKGIPPIPSWDDYFMSMAYLSASKSKDQRTHIGAVVVGPNNEVVSLGYNSFPRGINDNKPERQLKPEKYPWFEHGERNAIYNATLIGASLKGCKMYTNGVPCTDCGRGVIQSGILEVIVDKEWNEGNSQEDKEDSDKTLQMFGEAGIKVRYWTGDLLEIQKYRRGEIIG
jgi:dCMP deaminase